MKKKHIKTLKPRDYYILVGFFAIVIFVVFFKNGTQASYETSVVAKRLLQDSIRVIGTVKPTKKAELGFERSGRIFQSLVEEGDIVKKGEVLIRLDSSDLQAQLLGLQASLKAEEVRLAELIRGTRDEELKISVTNVSNNELSVEDSQKQLIDTKEQAEINLNSVYTAAIRDAQRAVVAAKQSILLITDIQEQYFLGSYNTYYTAIVNKNASAINDLLGIPYRENIGISTWAIVEDEAGTYGFVQDIVQNMNHADIDMSLVKSIKSLQLVLDSLDTIPIVADLPATTTNALITEKTTISGWIKTLSDHQSNISSQIKSNEKAINDAQTLVNNIENVLRIAQKELDLKDAGSTDEQLELQEARVDSARANIAKVYADISKTIIQAPFDGIIVENNAEVGEIAIPNDSLITLMNEDGLHVEADISELDIGKINNGIEGFVTLDAYGDTVLFPVVVTQVDPAETIEDNIPIYEITVSFVENDERIKSGMTANVTINVSQKTQALAVPSLALFERNNSAFVRVYNENKTIVDKNVEIGFVSDDGYVEIVNGLNEGDVIVIEQTKK